MPDARDIIVEMDENGLRLMGRPIKGPVPLEFLSELLGTAPRRLGIDPKPWEKPATRRGYVYDAFGLEVCEDMQRTLVYDLECFFQVDRSYEWRKTIAEFSGRACIGGVLLKADMVEKEVLALMPFIVKRISGRLRGEFRGQSVHLVFAKNKEYLASVPPYRRKMIPETLESLAISLSTDWRWGTGKLPPEGEIGPPPPLGGW